jgi:WXG100 family type VII secretion target
MDGYRVDLDRLADMIDQISQFDQRIESAQEDVDKQVDRLHTTWTGQAAAAHRQAHAEWMRGVAEMRAGLTEMRRNAGVAHDNYRSAVTTNSRMWEQAR